MENPSLAFVERIQGHSLNHYGNGNNIQLKNGSRLGTGLYIRTADSYITKQMVVLGKFTLGYTIVTILTKLDLTFVLVHLLVNI